MKALITRWFASATCVWCEREKECVTAEFGDGFLAKSQICWGCLQKAIKVRSQQDQADAANKTGNVSTNSNRQPLVASPERSEAS